jgi:hypothetical protein
MMLYSWFKAVYGATFGLSRTSILAALAAIAAGSLLALSIEKHPLHANKSWSDRRNLMALLLGVLMLITSGMVLSPVELKAWLPSSLTTFSDSEAQWLRVLALGLYLWTFYFASAHVYVPFGQRLRGRRFGGSLADADRAFRSDAAGAADVRPAIARAPDHHTSAGRSNAGNGNNEMAADAKQELHSSGESEQHASPNAKALIQAPAVLLTTAGAVLTGWVALALAGATTDGFWTFAPCIVGPVVVIAGLFMGQLRYYWLAVTGSLLCVPAAMFPFWGWLALAAGVFSLSRLIRPEVREAFRAKTTQP